MPSVVLTTGDCDVNVLVGVCGVARKRLPDLDEPRERVHGGEKTILAGVLLPSTTGFAFLVAELSKLASALALVFGGVNWKLESAAVADADVATVVGVPTVGNAVVRRGDLCRLLDDAGAMATAAKGLAG